MGHYTSVEVAKLTGYKRAWINILARTNRIEARKFGNAWLITENGLRQARELPDLRTKQGRQDGKQ